jgi:hypothetical protein
VTPNQTPRIRHYGSKAREAKTTPREKGLLRAEIVDETISRPNLTLIMTAPNGISPLKAKDAVKDTTIWLRQGI